MIRTATSAEAARDADLSDTGIRGEQIRSLLVAVLETAVEDLNWEEDPKTCWRQMKMDAAKWLLGVGRENGGGLALTDVTEILGVDARKVARALGAEKKLREWIDSKRRGQRIRFESDSQAPENEAEGSEWAGDGDGFDFDERVVYDYYD